MEHEIKVVALELSHGEKWTYFADDGTYAIERHLTLTDLQRAVVEMTAHAQLVSGVNAAA